MGKNIKAYLLVAFTFLAFNIGNNVALSQEKNDSIKSESLVLVHSPKKATLYSTFLPGLGQAYNKKYVKIPFIYVGFGALVYAVSWNNGEYNRFKDDYNKFPLDEFEGLISKDQLLTYVDKYRRYRDLSVIGIVVLWGLNIIDANVDAHFFSYDISPDISFKTEPVFNCYSFTNNYTGIKLSISF